MARAAARGGPRRRGVEPLGPGAGLRRLGYADAYPAGCGRAPPEPARRRARADPTDLSYRPPRARPHLHAAVRVVRGSGGGVKLWRPLLVSCLLAAAILSGCPPESVAGWL